MAVPSSDRNRVASSSPGSAAEHVRAGRAPISILVVSGSLNKGGAERFVSTLLQHFDRTRFRPALCLMHDDVGFPLPGDVALHVLDYGWKWHVPRTVLRLRRLIDQTRPDVLLSNLQATNLICGMALRGSAHQPAWVARVASNPKKADGRLGSFLARRIYPRADRVAVNSRGLVAAVESLYPFTVGRISVLRNPTDFDAIDRRAEEQPTAVKTEAGPLLIAVGRVGPEKRYDLMVDAVGQVRERHPAKLWICGDGPSRRAIRRRIRRQGLTDSVRLLGYCPNPHALMRQADVFVLSSDFEGSPNALIEAQGLGLAAVSTRCRYGPEEIIEDGHTGLLTPVGDAAALAEAIVRILAEADLRGLMGAAARASTRKRFAAGPLTRAWEAALSPPFQSRVDSQQQDPEDGRSAGARS